MNSANQNALRPITIIGGGLAGLTLGIALRNQDVPVDVFEASHYPRHRVCGEFISGRGIEVLNRLQLHQTLQRLGSRSATTAQFFSAHKASPVLPLPEPALCCPRFVLDTFLAEEFTRRGGALHTHQRWHQDWSQSGIVRATGRHIEPNVAGWRYFGLKAHACGVQTSADLELHFLENGYIGLCRISEDTVNVCGIFRSRQTIAGLADHWREWLSGKPDSILRQRLSSGSFVEGSFCSVAGLSLVPSKASSHAELAIGDAITMIPPFTGNGMSMAFESAELATQPCLEFARGNASWDAARAAADRVIDARFRRRLWSADWFQRLLFHPASQAFAMRLTSESRTLWRTLFQITR